MADKIIFEVVATAKGVKVVQQQTDKLAKSTDRADKSTKKLDKSRDVYNRREKGAANISSNSTKNFSKMQQGIDGGGGSGGLVRAYALLAANVFALTAAFGVLSRSAQIDTLTKSMEVLSVTGGTYIKTLAMDLRDASGGAVDLAQSFRQVSLATSAGLNVKEIEGLTQVAKGAALSLGRDLPDAMDRIFRGAIKLEPEILDEIGLFVRVDEAAEKYARSIGKSASSLTQAEKRQGFLNEILDQGSRKFQQYADTIKPDPYVKIAAALSDVAQAALSLVNQAFGPLIGFLAESKGLLTLVFGAVVFSLLRLAVPAIGQFNQGLAESAQKAADNARDYAKGISDTTKAQIKEDNTKVKSALKAQQEINRSTKPMALKVGGKDASSKLEAQLQDKKIKGAERQALIEKRIQDLKKGQNRASKDNVPLYQAEIDALEEEVRLEQKIVDLRTKKGKAKTISDPGTNAAKKQAALDQRAKTAGALSGITGTAETKGLGAAFDELKGKLKETEKVGGKTVKTFRGMNRGLFAVRGAFGIAAVGAQGLMMSLGPIMMVVGMALPLLIGMAKAMGFMSEESKALTADIEKLNDVIEDVGKRFQTQTDQIKGGTLSYFEAAKASDAFSKGQVDVVTRMTEVGKALEVFDKEATGMASGFDSFVSFISFGNWGQKAAANTSLVTAAAEQLGGALRSGDSDLVNVFSAALDGSEEYTSALENQIKAEEDNAVAAKALKDANLDSRKNLEKLTKLSKMASFENSKSAPLRVKFAEATKDLNETELAYVRTLGTLDKAQGKTAVTMKKLSGETNNLLDAADAAIEPLGDDGLGGAITMAEQKTANLKSALEEAGEAAGKFSAAFNVKTAIDDFANSLGVVKLAAEEAEGGLNKFLADVADPESANEFTRFFTEAELAIFKLAETAADGGKAAQAIFDGTVQDVKLYQRSLIMTKVDVKRLTDEIKRFGEVSAAGDKLANAQAEKQTDLARVKATGAKLQFEQRLKDKGLDRDQFKALEGRVALAGTQLEKEEALSGTGITLLELYGAQADKNADIAAAQALQVAELSESQRANIEITKQKLAQVTAQKQLNTALQTQARLTAENLALETRGTSKLTKQEEATLSMKTALDTFEITKQEVALKMTMLDFEMQIQKIKLQVLKESLPEGSELRGQIGEMGDLKTGKGSTGMFSTINSAQQTTEEALGIQLSNADLAISNSLKKSVETAFTGGLADGLLMVPQAIAAFEARAQVEGQSDEDRNKEDEKFKGELQMQAFRASMDSQAEALKKLGPEGELIASVVQGAFAISDAYAAMGTAVENGADKTAAGLQFAAAAIGQIGQMLAANSKAQIAEVDKQIEAEKKRDGKSAESIAKIKAMEKKKEAMKRKAFEQDKKMKMAQTVASTAAAIMQTLATGGAFALPMAVMIGAMGAAQLAIIAKTKYSGGASEVEKPAMGALSIGKRDNKVDVARGASGGELAYMRGQRGVGSNANDFRPTGGAYGMKSYAAGGEGILVGEQGPEIVTPTQPVDVTPMTSGGAQSVAFTINAVDAEGVEAVLERQRGNIIGMIRSAANGYGENFLEQVDTDVISEGGYQKA